MCWASVHVLIPAFAHVENAGQDLAAAEIGEAEEVYQEQQQYVGED